MVYTESMTDHNTKHTQHTPVLIVGGGLAGLSLALMLGKYQLPTVLLDACPAPAETLQGDMRTTAFMPSSVQYLRALGVWDSLSPCACPLETLRIIPIIHKNYRNQMGQAIDFNAADADIAALAYNLDNHTLRAVLCDAIAACDKVTHLFNTPATDMMQVDTDWHITTAAHIYTADVIVAADGRQSFIRQKSGITCDTHDYQQTALVCTVQHTKPHHNTSTEMMYADGAFTLVPMPNPNRSAVVWVEKTNYANSLITGDTQHLHTAFMNKTQGLWGHCDIVSAVQSFPLHTHIAHTHIVDNIALIGESHHGLTPVAAQGLNLSLRDSAVLAELLIAAHADSWHIATVLQTYKNARLSDIKTRSISTTLFHNMARAADPLSLGIKTFAASVFNRTKTARKLVIKAGLSLPGGTPKFMC